MLENFFLFINPRVREEYEGVCMRAFAAGVASVRGSLGVRYVLALGGATLALTIADGDVARGRDRCSGVEVRPGERTIQQAIESHGSGTTFCIHDGTYKLASTIVPKPGSSFIGVYSDGSRPVLDARHKLYWVMKARGISNVSVSGLSIVNAYGPGRDVDKSAGRGIWGGPGLRVTNSYFSGNLQSGIGGGGGWVITDSFFVGNGSDRYLGCCSAGIKSGTRYTIRNSVASDNVGNGMWCDGGCSGGTWLVENNVAAGNTHGGIRYERSSSGALIQQNKATQNGDGGIEINSSQDAVVESNVLGGNDDYGIGFEGNRETVSGRATNNDLNGDRIKGCGDRVYCAGNR